MRRVLIAAVSTLALQCAAPAPQPAAGAPAPATRAPASPPQSDAMSRVDAMLADAAKREADYQQALKDQKERKAAVPVYDQYTPHGAVIEGEIPVPTAGRDRSWWLAEMQELRRRVSHNGALLRQAEQKVKAAREQLQTGQGDQSIARLALRDAEAEFQRFMKATYRDADAITFMREEAQRLGVPKEWLEP